MTTRDRTNELRPAPAPRIAAFALAFALSVLTLGAAMPGGAAYVADRLLPDAGNAYETIAARGATEVEILPGRIEVVGIRTQANVADRTSAQRG